MFPLLRREETLVSDGEISHGLELPHGYTHWHSVGQSSHGSGLATLIDEPVPFALLEKSLPDPREAFQWHLFCDRATATQLRNMQMKWVKHLFRVACIHVHVCDVLRPPHC